MNHPSPDESLPKFRVATNQAHFGTITPIRYEVIQYNHLIEYNNGVVIILYPGWYTFTANTRGNAAGQDHIAVQICVENRPESYGQRLVLKFDSKCIQK